MKALILIVALATAAAAADLTVGNITARSGEQANGWLAVPAGPDAAGNIPIILINGAKPGPTIAFVAGAHGTEYASILALQKLAHAVDPATLSGSVIIAPLLNVGSFSQIVPHLNPIDQKNMNRFYPGKSDGTQTERISWTVTRQILDKSDYLVDFHGGDLDENLRRYSYWADTGQEQVDSVSRGMVLAFGLDHIIIQKARTPPAPGAPITITRQFQMMGKPAIAVEAGHAGTTTAGDIAVLVDGSLNVMRHLKILPGTVRPVEQPVWLANAATATADRDGVFYPLALPEGYVRKGMAVGYLSDYFGDKISDVVAPVSGVIIYIRAVPSAKKGDTLAYIGEIAEQPN
jgi:predicted deacylase